MMQSQRPDSHDTPLHEDQVKRDPIAQFQSWYADAERAIPEPNAMVLATATRDGVPSARVVLLKGFDKEGFIFFTNYLSRKGAELLENPRGSLVVFWPPLERQVRIEGNVEKIDGEVSARYFHSRPRLSQISAVISEQSREISNRELLEERAREFDQRLEGREVPRPDHWGGYRLRHHRIEFWQGRAGRLHDRLLYTLQKGEWKITRLQP